MEIVFVGGDRLVVASQERAAELARRFERTDDEQGEPMSWYVPVRLPDGGDAWVNPDVVAYILDV
jgi:hypothetical protein